MSCFAEMLRIRLKTVTQLDICKQSVIIHNIPIHNVDIPRPRLCEYFFSWLPSKILTVNCDTPKSPKCKCAALLLLLCFCIVSVYRCNKRHKAVCRFVYCRCCEQPRWFDVTCWTRSSGDHPGFPRRNSELRGRKFRVTTFSRMQHNPCYQAVLFLSIILPYLDALMRRS